MVIPDLFSYPGSKATNASLCHGTIRDGYCRGKGLKEKCDTHMDCDVGLRCGMYKECEEASKEGEWCDEKENLCKTYLTCKEGHCVRYGTVSNNESPGIKQDPDLCKSHHIFKGVCAEAPKLDGKIFVDKIEDICDYTNGEKSPAQCGYHRDAKAICKPGDADLATEWQELLDFLSAKPECNTFLGYFSICDYAEKQVGRKYLKAGINYYLLHQYVSVQENAECMKRYNFPAYFDLVKQYNGAATVSAVLGIFVTVLLLLI